MGKSDLKPIQKGEVRNKTEYATRKLISEVRLISRHTFHEAVSKYANASKAEVKKAVEDPNLPMMEAMIVSVINRAINKGDYKALDFLLDRTVGKVVQAFEFVPPPPPPEPITIDVSSLPTELLRTINGAITAKDVTPQHSNDQGNQSGDVQEGLPRVPQEKS